ncbi:hypothetical protein BST81_25640 [Leptolyngbya sp. 'hensonii']|uniref:hypothetical protein n=1 Tax=Leptolyngbya sp. 'hensonii' TaxID=1922337 RepID=UPI00095013D7|nr:hypothetical protein [Leptolyngbya sp. 'hensonii']OLP15538.1 hypothetical protein BST81_25640 [Leptolyngbya sp. 'hensonii']
MQDQPSPESAGADTSNALAKEIRTLVEAVTKAVILVGQNHDRDNALIIRDQLRQLPDAFTTEVLNGMILNLVKIDPELCRWFIVDVFLQDANLEGKADVAERINLLLDDLRSL